MAPAATILIPTYDHGPTLRASVSSALHQSIPDVEVFIVGDGVPPDAREIIQELVRSDLRVRFFDNPKGPRHGEPYRHEALAHAAAPVVCYLSDDDLFVSNHVEQMIATLEHADFAHAVAVEVHPEGKLSTWNVDLAHPIYRREILAGRNRVPLSAAAHTLDFYRRLLEGWTAAPRGIATDVFMWQKFVRHPECRFRAALTPSVLVFPSTTRPLWSSAQRLKELDEWTARLAAPGAITALHEQLLPYLIQESAAADARFLESVHVRGRVLKELALRFLRRKS